MFLFGHAGITLAAAVLINRAIGKSHNPAAGTPGSGAQPPSATQDSNLFSKVTSWLTSLAGSIDIRLLLIGSLLPDIIDKPIGRLFFRETFNNGRIFAHTLAFLVVLTLSGWLLYWSRKKNFLLVLSFGVLTHLFLDIMWKNPRTLLWPLYGLSFWKSDYDYSFIRYLQRMLQTVIDHPEIGIPEYAGAAVVIWFGWVLIRRRTLFTFLKNGRV